VLDHNITYRASQDGMKSSQDRDIVEHMGVTIDCFSHKAFLEQRELPLTPGEFRLLDYLVRRPGQTFSRETLLKITASRENITNPRTVDYHVRTLRRKLGSPELIEKVWGLGYRFKMNPG
jgi:DNA-binding response OmpR family regulator